MNWQKYAVVTAVFPVVLGLGGCADATNKYRDTSELEEPPHLEIVITQSDQSTESDLSEKNQNKKNLKSLVSLLDESHLMVNYPFDVAWLVIEKMLILSRIEIADRNRDKGQYFVIFDPDTADSDSGESGGLIADLLSTDRYPKARYALTFYENPKSVKVKVEFLEYTENDYSTQDGYVTKAPPDNGVEKLLKKLYSTLDDNAATE